MLTSIFPVLVNIDFILKVLKIHLPTQFITFLKKSGISDICIVHMTFSSPTASQTSTFGLSVYGNFELGLSLVTINLFSEPILARLGPDLYRYVQYMCKAALLGIDEKRRKL